MVRRTPSLHAVANTVALLPSNHEIAFPDLDDREARFVVEYVARSGTRGMGADAALAAGYSNGNRDAAHSMASRLLRRPTVLKAIHAETGRRLGASAPLGVAVLESLAQSARSEQVRLSAAKELVDRGYGPVTSRSASLSVSTSVEDLLAALDAAEGVGQAQALDITPDLVRDPRCRN